MTSPHAKVLTCPACKATAICSPDQADGAIRCPQCGARIAFPAEQAGPPPLPMQKGSDASVPPLPIPQQIPHRESPYLRDMEPPQARRKGKRCLLFGCLGCLSVILLTVGLGVFMAFTALTPERLANFCENTHLVKPLISHGLLPATSPAAATLGGSDIDISVIRAERACPTIYQEALRSTSASHTPVYCVAIEITNRGTIPAHYRSWRELTDEADLKRAATLRDGAGRLHGAVSFGPRTWPEGTQSEQDIAPGDTCQDILLFECGGETPDVGFLLTLPGENLGHKGRLRFRIPRDQIRNEVSASDPSR